MTQPGHGEDAGQLDLAVVADLRGFAARLRREVNAATAKVAAKVAVEPAARGLATKLRKAVKEAGEKTQAVAPIGVRIGVAVLRRAVKDVADKANAEARIGVRISPADFRRAVKDVAAAANATARIGLQAGDGGRRLRDQTRQAATEGLREGGRDGTPHVERPLRLGIVRSLRSGFRAGFRGMFAAVREQDTSVGRAVALGVAGGVVRGVSSGFGAAVDTVQEFAGTMNRLLSSAAQAGVAVIGSTVSGAATTAATGGLNLLLGVLLAIAAAIPLVLGGFLALAPVLLLVGGLWGSLWTVMAGGLGVIAVLAMATRGLGDAFSELAKDGKVSADTLKKLSPSARSFVKEIEKLTKPFGRLAKYVQERVFEKLAKPFGDLARKWLPSLEPMLGNIAGSLNRFVRSLIKGFSNTDVIRRFMTMAAGFSDFLDRIGAAMPAFVDAWARLGAASLPVLEKIGDLLGGAIEDFAAWIKKAEETGELQTFMESAAQALQDIWDIGGLVVGIVGEIIDILFPSADKASDTFLTGVKASLQDVKDWLADPENKAKIQEWIDKIQEFAEKVTTEWIPKVIEWAGKVEGWIKKAESWVNGILSIPDKIGDAWEQVKRTTEEKWGAVVGFFQSLPGRVLGWLEGLRQGAVELFSSLWEQATTAVETGVQNVVRFFSELGSQALAAVQALPGQLAEWAKNIAVQTAYWIGYGVGLVVGWWLSLPQKAEEAWNSVVSTVETAVANVISWCEQLPGRLGAFATETWNRVKTAFLEGKNAVVSYVESLPGKLSELANSAKEKVVSAFTSLWSSVKTKASEGASSVVTFVKSIPDKLGDLGSLLKTAGGQLIDGLKQGIKDAAGRAVQAAKDVVNSAIRGAKDALGINSPSKVFAAIGRQVVEGYTLGLEAKRPSAAAAAERLAASTIDPFDRPTPAGESAGAGAEGGQAPLIGSVTLGAADRRTAADQLDELMFRLRVIRRGGVVAGG